MDSTSLRFQPAGRQLTPLSLSVVLTVAAVTPLSLVWAAEEAVFKPDLKSEQELLDFYAEEFFIEEQSAVEDEAEAQAAQEAIVAAMNAQFHGLERIILAGLVFSIQSCFATQELRPKVIAAPVYDEQQACRPYPAGTTILFDTATTDETADELALRAIFAPEDFPALFMRPVQQTVEYTPTPELLDTSDLKLQPIRATRPLHDTISQMLDFDLYNDHQVQETAPENAPKREGRSLMRPPPVYTDSELDELDTDEYEIEIDKHGKFTKRKVTLLDDDNGPRDWEVEYDCVLRRITGHSLLPGIEYLSNIESRSAFVTYGNDVQALQQPTAEFLNDCRNGECACLVCKVEAAVDNLLLVDNVTAVGLSLQYPTAKSLLDLIDNIVDNNSLVEDNVSYASNTALFVRKEFPRFDQTQFPLLNQKPVHIEETRRQGAFFDAARFQYTNYTSLDRLLGYSNMSDIVCAQYDAADNVSDMSETKVAALSMTQPSELTYFDADTQQCVAYTAFNQLLIALDHEEILPRIHHMQDDFDDDILGLVGGLVEIGSVSASNDVAEPGCSSSQDAALKAFDFDLDLGDIPTQSVFRGPTLSRSRSIDSLRSYSYIQRQKSKRRPQLTGITQLDSIMEVSSDEDIATPSTASSDSSVDFADQRGFVRTLSARRADFLDDEGSEDDSVEPQSAGSSDSSEADSLYSSPVLRVVKDVYELFNGAIWYREPNVQLTLPYDTQPPSANRFPDPDVLEALETEINGLIAYMFECIIDGRSNELTALGSDLQWALSAIANDFPSFGLVERLGVAVEILLEQLVALGVN